MIKWHLKPNVFKLNPLFSHPSPASAPTPLFPSPFTDVFVILVNETSIPSLSQAKNVVLLVLHLNLWATYKVSI